MDSLSAEKVCYIIAKAKEFDVKVEPVAPDPGHNPADDDELDVLEDFAADPTFDELTSAIRELNSDEQIELVALTWIGRGSFTGKQWLEAVAEARDARNDRTAEYLTGIPLLGDYLEEGLTAMGYACEEYEARRL